MMQFAAREGIDGRREEEHSPKIRVLVAINQLLVRQGLTALLNECSSIEVLEDQTGRRGLVATVVDVKPDVVLIGCETQLDKSLDELRALSRAAPEVRLVVLSESQSGEDIVRAIMAGASGFLSMNGSFRSLSRTIEAVGNGEVGLSRELTTKLVYWLQQSNGQLERPKRSEQDTQVQEMIERLSPRERIILGWIGRGASNKEIARALCLSEHTIRSHVTNTLTKLGMSSRVQAAVLAVRSQAHSGHDVETGLDDQQPTRREVA